MTNITMAKFVLQNKSGSTKDEVRGPNSRKDGA